jgi:hypothetical protein
MLCIYCEDLLLGLDNGELIWVNLGEYVVIYQKVFHIFANYSIYLHLYCFLE